MELYQKLLIYAKDNQFKHGSDSGLVRLSLEKLLKGDEFYKINQYRMEGQAKTSREDNLKLQATIDVLQGSIRDLKNDLVIRKHNINVKKEKKK